MPRPVHFETQAADPKRAIAFYNALFGWSFNKWEGPQDYWLIKTGEPGTIGINGGLLPRRGPPPVPMQAINAYVCTVGIDDLDATVKSRRAGYHDRGAENGDSGRRLARLRERHRRQHFRDNAAGYVGEVSPA